MKKLFSLLLLLLLGSTYSVAEEASKYSIGNLSPKILKGANAVIRKQEVEVAIENEGAAKKHSLFAITILNTQAEDYAEMVITYDKFSSLKSFKASSYDAQGKLIRQLKPSEIGDYKYQDESLYSDNRYKIATLKSTTFPYTVEFEYDISYTGLLFLPSWQPVPEVNIAVESASYRLSSPEDFVVHYLENLLDPAKKTNANKRTTYLWETKNFQALSSQYYAPDIAEYTPSLLVTSEKFNIQGTQGNMGSWKNFGLWSYQLNAGRDVLPSKVKTKVHELCDNLPDEISKTKALYNFLQKNTRYISVQLGIGGWQTFDAQYVSTYGYGDCKALSNYMIALLKEVGIDAYAALIRAGANASGIHADFPSQQFNHVIVQVPLSTGAVWLECTSQHTPFNYLGNFTADRWALVIKPEGGSLVKTPALNERQNGEQRDIKIVLQDDGQLSGTLVTHYRGALQDNLSYYIASETKQEQEKRIYQKINLPNLQIKTFETSVNTTTETPEIIEKLNVSFSQYCSISGKRLFLVPNLVNRQSSFVQKDSLRKVDIIVKPGYTDIDKIVYELPEGYNRIESKPNDLDLNTPFGSFKCSSRLEGKHLIYERRFVRKEGRFKPSQFNEFCDFYNAISKADNSRIVLVKQGT